MQPSLWDSTDSPSQTKMFRITSCMMAGWQLALVMAALLGDLYEVWVPTDKNSCPCHGSPTATRLLKPLWIANGFPASWACGLCMVLKGKGKSAASRSHCHTIDATGYEKKVYVFEWTNSDKKKWEMGPVLCSRNHYYLAPRAKWAHSDSVLWACVITEPCGKIKWENLDS